LYLLRVGYGGTMGALTDIDQEGFASAAFHSFPDMLKPDPYSGDYGPNFFGHAWNTATYLVRHPEYGWLAFGGNIKTQGSVVTLTPLDSARSRVFIAPAGLWLTLESGTLETVEFNSETGVLKIGLAAANENTPEAVLRVEEPAKANHVSRYHPAEQLKSARNAYIVPLGAQTTWVTLQTAPQ
jgi:hypothetical protein